MAHCKLERIEKVDSTNRYIYASDMKSSDTVYEAFMLIMLKEIKGLVGNTCRK